MAEPTPGDVAQWASELTHGDAAARASAAEQLSRHPGEAGQAALALVQAVADADEGVREWVTAALEALDAPPPSQCEELAALTGHAESDVAYWAATLLGRMGEAAAPAVGRLSGVLESSAADNVRERTAWALGKIGPPAKSAAPQLQQAANSDKPRLARTAAKALEAIGA